MTDRGMVPCMEETVITPCWYSARRLVLAREKAGLEMPESFIPAVLPSSCGITDASREKSMSMVLTPCWISFGRENSTWSCSVTWHWPSAVADRNPCLEVSATRISRKDTRTSTMVSR